MKGCGEAPVAAIAIDGPAGAGKSTTARAVARRLGLVYLDSGALYRALAVAAAAAPAKIEQEEDLARFLSETRIDAAPVRAGFEIQVNGRVVSAELRTPAIDERASRLATFPLVREHVAKLLRELAGRYPAVAEGRDMGATVFPDARLKIFLTASLDERTSRRGGQLRREGLEIEEAQVRAAIEERDRRDTGRAASPLRPAPDSVRLDTTKLSFEEQVELVVALYRGGGWVQGSWGLRMVCAVGRALFRLLLGLRQEGRSHLPHGPFLLASNHKSYLDPPLLGSSVPGRLGYLAKEELFRIPIMGPLIRALGAIPIRRGTADRRGLARAIEHLGRGLPLAVFPEGTRIRGPGLGAPHAGIALLARRAGVPVVPVRIWGSEHPWRALLLRTPIWVIFGRPMAPPGEGEAGSARDFAASVMTAIEALQPPKPG